MKKILVIGESCQDVFHYGKAERLEPAVPVPVFVIQETTENLGMAGNTYKNIESLCKLNKEEATNFINKKPSKAIAIVLFETNTATNTTITKTRFIDKRSNHMFLRVDARDDKYGRCLVDEIKDLESFDAIIVSDYNKGFLTEEDIIKITERNPNVFLDTKKPLSSFANKCSFIKVNYSEYKKAEQIGDFIKNKLIVTLGENGAFHNRKHYHVPKVINKELSGSGDTFMASLVFNYVQTKNIEESIIFANKCCTINVQKKGVSTITTRDLESIDQMEGFDVVDDIGGVSVI